MPQIINTNIASLTAQRNLNTSQTANQTALNRLSSGLRINSAKDDAAGLSISTRFTSQVKGLNVAIRNAGDGVSLAQTAEGAIGSMTDNLQRIRELALQSANATNSDIDRVALQAEVDQLISEVTRTADKTNFNGTNLLDGGFNATFQVGANSGETVTFDIGELTASTLGGADASGVSAIGSDSGIGNGDLTINGTNIGPSSAADDKASSGAKAASAIAKVAAINKLTSSTGVIASVITNTAAGTTQVAAATTGTITLNGVTISVSTGGLNTDADRQSVVTAINANKDMTGVTAVDTGDLAGGVELEAADGRNVVLAFASGTLTAAATGLAAAGTYEGGYVLRSEVRGTDITITGGDNSGQGNLANSGLRAGVYSDGTAAVSNVSQTARNSQALGAGVVGTVAPTTPVTFTNGREAVAAFKNGADASAVFAYNTNNATFDVVFDDTAAATTVTMIAGTTADDEVSVAAFNSALTTAGLNTRMVAFADAATGNIDFKLIGADASDGTQFHFSNTTGNNAAALTAINAALGGLANLGVTTTNGVQGFAGNSVSSTTLTAFDFSGNNGTFNVTLGNDSAVTLTINTDLTAANVDDVATLVTDINTDIAANGGTLVNRFEAFNNGGGIGFRAIGTAAAEALNFTLDTYAGAGSANVAAAIGVASGTVTSTGSVTGNVGAFIEADSFGSATFDFSGNNAAFDVTIGSTTTTVTVNTDSTNNIAGMLTVVNAGITAASLNTTFTAVDNGAGLVKLELIGTAEDGTTNFAIGNIRDINGGTGGDAALTAVFGGIVEGLTTTNADASAVRNNTLRFRLNGATTDTAITLSSGTLQSADDVINEMNAQLTGATATIENGLIGIRSDTTGATGNVASLNGTALSKIGMTSTTAVAAATVGGGTALSVGDLFVNDVAIVASLASSDTSSDTTANSSSGAASGIAIAAAINSATKSTEVTAKVNATEVVGGTGSTTVTARNGDTGFVRINGVTTAGITTSGDNEADRITALGAINAVSTQTGVVATDNGSSLTLTAADGRNISVAIDTNDVANETRAVSFNAANYALGIGLNSTIEGIGRADLTTGGGTLTYAAQAQTTYSTVTLNSASEIKVKSGSNGATAVANLGFTQGTFGGGKDGQFLKDVDISTFDGAVEAIAAIDNALNSLSGERAKLGAVQNRFESTIANLSITSENLSAANSRIQDADFAAETAELARTQVLQQAGISILAQANAAPQQILSLLQ